MACARITNKPLQLIVNPTALYFCILYLPFEKQTSKINKVTDQGNLEFVKNFL